MTTKKIAIVINDLKGNGAERFAITLTEALQKHGHDARVFCFKSLTELEFAKPIIIHNFPMFLFRWIPRNIRGRFTAFFLDSFIKLKMGTPDLVLSNLLPVDRVLCESKLKNTYLVIHSTMTHEVFNALDEKDVPAKKQQFNDIYSKKPSICVSDGVLHDFKVLFPNSPHSQRIYNPINPEFILKSSKQENPFNGTQYLVHVGKFNKAKRHDILVRAYAKSSSTLPLILVGKGNLLEQTRQLAKDLGVEDRVIFAGFHANPYPIIAGATALICSSDFEGLGLVILEAIALNVPVISTDCDSGPREILPSHNLSPVGDTDLLAKKIDNISQAPSKYLTQLSKEFHPDSASRQYLALCSG